MASCGVCFDEAPELALRGDRLLSLPCTHQFCGRCLDDWTDSYNKKKKKNNNNNNNDNNNNNNNDLPGKRSDVQGEAPCPQCRMVFDRQVVEDLSRPLGVVDYVIIPVMLGVLVFQQTFKFLMDLPSKVARVCGLFLFTLFFSLFSFLFSLFSFLFSLFSFLFSLFSFLFSLFSFLFSPFSFLLLFSLLYFSIFSPLGIRTRLPLNHTNLHLLGSICSFYSKKMDSIVSNFPQLLPPNKTIMLSMLYSNQDYNRQ